uniref:Uncharacterized protein n=1 Tax=Anguilla anguilla TaxID=7936 RepID=A0A0E9SYK3_ANGAN
MLIPCKINSSVHLTLIEYIRPPLDTFKTTRAHWTLGD